MVKRGLEYLLAVAVYALYGTYRLLWRVQRIDLGTARVPGRPRIYAHWHGDELLLVGTNSGTGMAVMASRSRDGELMRRVLEWFGYRVVRGSSSRGGAGGLKGLIDCVRHEGRDASLAVDGPRGPRGVVKPGILSLAQATGCEIVPGAGAANSKYVFKNAWNRCYLPLPLARCVIVLGESLSVPKDCPPETFEALRSELERRLQATKAEAERWISDSKKRGVAQLASALASGARGPGFKSPHPD